MQQTQDLYTPQNTEFPQRIPAYRYGPEATVKQLINVNESFEGETIERRVERILNNKEPITDGAPQIFTERSQGVIPEYNIRTDRFDQAIDMTTELTNRELKQRTKRAEERATKNQPPKTEPTPTPTSTTAGPGPTAQ